MIGVRLWKGHFTVRWLFCWLWWEITIFQLAETGASVRGMGITQGTQQGHMASEVVWASLVLGLEGLGDKSRHRRAANAPGAWVSYSRCRIT
jgi:hypothetical protein